MKLAYKELKKRVDSIKKHKSNDLLWILEHPLPILRNKIK